MCVLPGASAVVSSAHLLQKPGIDEYVMQYVEQ
jgi:hypothetical protein